MSDPIVLVRFVSDPIVLVRCVSGPIVHARHISGPIALLRFVSCPVNHVGLISDSTILVQRFFYCFFHLILEYFYQNIIVTVEYSRGYSNWIVCERKSSLVRIVTVLRFKLSVPRISALNGNEPLLVDCSCPCPVKFRDAFVYSSLQGNVFV